MRTIRSIAVLLTVLLWACAPQATAAPGMDRFVDPANGWSISYPVGWRLDGSDPAVFQFHDPENQALVGVRVMPTDLPLNASVDQMLASYAQRLQEKQLTWAVSSRQLTSLPNGTTAVSVRGDLVPGGRSRQLYVVKGGKVFGVNAETYLPFWDKFAGNFEQMVESFRPPA